MEGDSESGRRTATVSVPLVGGDDCEVQAIGAVVHLLEQVRFGNGRTFDKGLSSAERDRVVRYLFDRYTVAQNIER